MQNPFFEKNTLPPFDRIQPAHYLPALDRAIDGVREKVAKMKSDKSAPTFANTVVPLESLFRDVLSVMLPLGNAGANTYSKEIAAIEEEASLKYAALSKSVFQDPELGARFRAVYDARDSLALDEDDKAVLKHLHDDFEASGALLPPEGQAKIRDIDEKLIRLTQKFRDNAQEAPAKLAVLVTDPAELAGLSAEEIEGFAENARSNGHAAGWLITPERLLVDELLERAAHSGFRKKIFTALNDIGRTPPHDNRPLIQEIQVLRDEYAKLLGYDHYASFARSRAMWKDLGDVHRLLDDVAEKALPKFEEDMRALEKFSAASGGPSKLEPWDVSFWAMKQRDALYNFDANGFAQYLELENVMRGMFAEAEHLFGIEFSEVKGHPVLHPDIRVYEVRDRKTGADVGFLHVDMFARPGTKSGGAWMSQLQAAGDDLPNIVILNMNISRPPAGKPALIGLSQYITLYHEMGHSLQGLLGTDVKYQSLQGTAAPADFVEFHSMVNERRAVLKQNLKKYALHVETGQPAPDSMIDALIGSRAHFEAREMLKLVQNSLRDLAFHEANPKEWKGDDALEKYVALDSDYVDHIRAYPLARFGHLFSDAHGGYAAGYVNYLIAQVHAADGFAPFEKAPYERVQAEKLAALYRRGSGGDPAGLYRDYRGADATADAMLREAGIDAAPAGRPAASRKSPPPPPAA